MEPLPDPPQTDPPLGELLLKGFLLILGAFLAAPIVLMMHAPSGH